LLFGILNFKPGLKWSAYLKNRYKFVGPCSKEKTGKRGDAGKISKSNGAFYSVLSIAD
jgi:hypothetical protein